MINTLRKYMVVDLLILAVIGTLLEGICTKFSCIVLAGTPTSLFGMLIVMLAVTRWNLWGLLVCPIIALGNLIGGSMMELDYMAAVYDYKLYLSVIIGYMIFGLEVILFKKFTTKRIIISGWFFLLIIANYLLFNLVQSGSYYLICKILDQTSVIMQVPSRNEEGELIYNSVNVCKYGQNGLAYNALGAVVLLVGGFVLRSQGIFVNVKQKFIDDKQSAELIRKDEERFSIGSIESSDVGEKDSQKDNDESHI